MKAAVLLCLVQPGIAVRKEADGASGPSTGTLLDQINNKADSMLSQFYHTRAATLTDPDPAAAATPQANAPAPPPQIVFDENFFTDKCDLGELTAEGFNQPKYLYSSDTAIDDARWVKGKKCEDANLGLAQVVDLKAFAGSKHACAQKCQEKALAKKGEVVCCMYHFDDKQCVGWMGWQSKVDSSYGTNRIFTWMNRRTAKEGRLIYSPLNAAADLSGEEKEMTDTGVGQDFVKDLATQVNQVSIDGILDHLLSFYVCMRWVPDAEFVRLAQFEVATTSVDAATLAEGPRTRDQVLDKTLEAGLTPLRCNSAINVQHMAPVQDLLDKFNRTTSEMYQLYDFSRKIWKSTDTGVFNGAFLRERRALNTALKCEGDCSQDSVFVSEMRKMARKPENLPWMTFLRSSNDFDHHFSSSDNLFMVCFGPRVASFPHKRENGQHILADGNMAGCNAFWDFTTMKDQIERIKKLFAPEMCFEHTLRKELKDKFLATFVEMNEEFELSMQNRFTKRVHQLDPTKNSALDMLSERKTDFEFAGALSTRETTNAYRKIAAVVANANSKWVLCPAKAGSDKAAFGNEDNFFRNPKAYKKWIGELTVDTTPQCKTYDPITGCVKCVVAVLDQHRCHVRLNVTLPDIFKAIRDKAYPFLNTAFVTEEEVETEFGHQLKKVTNQGACMVRKSIATSSKALENNLIQDVKDAFFSVNTTDSIVNVVTRDSPEVDGTVTSDNRFQVSKRKKAVEKFVLDGGSYTTDETERLIEFVAEEQYVDKAADWPKKFIFTHEEPEENNRPAHKVDYFMSCPCTSVDMSAAMHFQQFGSIGMGEYYNFR